MRRFCFLLSFVVVNVLADIELYGNFVEQAELTNRQIQRVQCGDVRLIPVIRKFVLADKPMRDLSFMFAGPLKVSAKKSPLYFLTRTPREYEEMLQHRIDLEIELQTAITTLLGVSVPEKDRPRSLVRTAMRTLCCTCEPQDLSDLFVDLKMHDRRRLFHDATKLFISSALRPGHEDFGNYNLMCRLKGVYRGIIDYDNDYSIIQAEVFSDHCRLTRDDETSITVSCIGDDIRGKFWDRHGGAYLE